MQVQVDVTEEDIANGKRREATCCPYALAITRACSQFGIKETSVSPYGNNVVIDLWIGRAWVSNSAKLTDPPHADNIRRFDDDGPMEPTSFVLEIPDIV